jgi:glycosyltransferase involved in cell wall biosynthesis
LTRKAVAVVIPTLERPALLQRALLSVERAADHAGLLERVEVVVVDDAGESAVPAPVGRLAVRRVTHPQGPRQGPAACRNFGIRSTDAPFLYLLDDDDEFLPNRFERSLPLLEAGRAQVVLERASRERVSPGGRLGTIETGPSEETAAIEPFEFLLTQPEAGHIASGATAFSREAFESAGEINERLRYCEDGEFLLRLALATRVALVAGPPVVEIHRHEGNVSRVESLRYWQPLKAFSVLYRSVDWTGKAAQESLLKAVITGKLDYALSRCRHEYGYGQRLREGAAALAQVPLSLLTLRNLRSIVVWLLWPRPRRA